MTHTCLMCPSKKNRNGHWFRPSLGVCYDSTGTSHSPGNCTDSFASGISSCILTEGIWYKRIGRHSKHELSPPSVASCYFMICKISYTCYAFRLVYSECGLWALGMVLLITCQNIRIFAFTCIVLLARHTDIFNPIKGGRCSVRSASKSRKAQSYAVFMSRKYVTQDFQANR